MANPISSVTSATRDPRGYWTEALCGEAYLVRNAGASSDLDPKGRGGWSIASLPLCATDGICFP